MIQSFTESFWYTIFGYEEPKVGNYFNKKLAASRKFTDARFSTFNMENLNVVWAIRYGSLWNLFIVSRSWTSKLIDPGYKHS